MSKTGFTDSDGFSAAKKSRTGVIVQDNTTFIDSGVLADYVKSRGVDPAIAGLFWRFSLGQLRRYAEENELNKAIDAFGASFVGTRKKWSKKLGEAIERDEIWAGDTVEGTIYVFDQKKFDLMMMQ